MFRRLATLPAHIRGFLPYAPAARWTALACLAVFLIQLILNMVWSVLFFGLRSPLYGLMDILFLWAMILVTIAHFSKVSTLAAALLIPYILWVTFATGLNFGIFLLNR